MRLEHPARREVCGAEQTCLVGIVADRQKIDRHLVGREDDGGAADGELTHATGTKAAAHDDTFGIAPGLELEETADDECELLREILDRPLQNTGRFRIALDEQRVRASFC